MKKFYNVRLTVISALLFTFPVSNIAFADVSQFTTGPVFHEYGKNVVINNGLSMPKKQQFKVVFDVSERSEEGKVNRKFDTLARFINMHVRAGVPIENIDVALVVHGAASNDLLNKKAYEAKFSASNPSAELINLLLKNSVNIYLCGQSAVYMDINDKDLLPGVNMSLSAMTANALLQQQGYTLNPF